LVKMGKKKNKKKKGDDDESSSSGDDAGVEVFSSRLFEGAAAALKE